MLPKILRVPTVRQSSGQLPRSPAPGPAQPAVTWAPGHLGTWADIKTEVRDVLGVEDFHREGPAVRPQCGWLGINMYQHSHKKRSLTKEKMKKRNGVEMEPARNGENVRVEEVGWPRKGANS